MRLCRQQTKCLRQNCSFSRALNRKLRTNRQLTPFSRLGLIFFCGLVVLWPRLRPTAISYLGAIMFTRVEERLSRSKFPTSARRQCCHYFSYIFHLFNVGNNMADSGNFQIKIINFPYQSCLNINFIQIIYKNCTKTLIKSSDSFLNSLV